jgi:hypothetical protein
MKWNWACCELKTEFLSKWERIRQRGKWRFVVLRGVVAFGGLLFILWSVISYGAGFRFQFLAMHVVVSLLAGLVMGLLAWHRTERAYRRQTGRV